MVIYRVLHLSYSDVPPQQPHETPSPQASHVHLTLNESTILFSSLSSWAAHIGEWGHHAPKHQWQKIGCPLSSALSLLFPTFSFWNGKISLISVNPTTAFGALPVGGLHIPALLSPGGIIKPALVYEQKHCVCPSGRTFKGQFVTHYVYFSFCHNSRNVPHKEASLSSWVLEWGGNGEEPQTAYHAHVFWVRKSCKPLRLEGLLVTAVQPSISCLIHYPNTCTTREKPALKATESCRFTCYHSTTEHIPVGKLP